MSTSASPVVVVMGPSGCGKTVIGVALAHQLRCRFVEGDDLHPPANVAKMRAGIALDDEDRRPWLEAIAREIASLGSSGVGGVVSCSALRHRYRAQLSASSPQVTFVLPRVPYEVLIARVAARAGHYMPSGLVASQLATLEPPTADEGVVEVDGTHPLPALIDELVIRLAQRGGPAAGSAP